MQNNLVQILNRVSACALLAALMILSAGLSACTPKPKPLEKPAASTRVMEPAGGPGLGSFSLQKRHGLGAWDGQKRASESDVLERIGQEKSGPMEPSTR